MGSEELALFERLVRIETKLDVSNATHDDHESRIRSLEGDNDPQAHSDHESRLRRLERSVLIATGFAAAVGGVAGQVSAHLL